MLVRSAFFANRASSLLAVPQPRKQCIHCVMAQPNDYNYHQSSYSRRRKKKNRYNNNNQQSQYYPQQQQQQQSYHHQQYYQQPQQQHAHQAHGSHYQQQARYQSTSKQHAPQQPQLLIDGSMMEGGGQILRNSTTLAALMKRSIHITNIRGNRSTPGLRSQHSKGIELVHKINGGYLDGNFVKSMDIKYYPSEHPKYLNHYMIDIGTAGSVCLLIQTCLPLLLFSPFECSVTCIGGTNASFAPQVDWFILVLQPMLKRLMNIEIDIQCIQRGFFPKGGGKVVMRTNPIEHIGAFDLTKKGNLCKIYGQIIIRGRGYSLSIGDDIIRGATRELQMAFGKKIDIELEIVPKERIDSFSDGIGVVVVAETDTGCLFGGSSLQGPKKKSGGYGKNKQRGGGGGWNNYNDDNKGEDYSELGRVAARELITDWNSTKGGCTDRWLQDQLIIFMALAKGKSKMATCALELHTETAIYIAELMTGVKFNVSTENDGTVMIECDGIGYTAGMKLKRDEKGNNTNINKKKKDKAEQKLNDDNVSNTNNADTDTSREQQKNKLLSNRPSLF